MNVEMIEQVTHLFLFISVSYIYNLVLIFVEIKVLLIDYIVF